MTLKEFDQIRPFLPENTIVTIQSTAQTVPAAGQDWAIEVCSWGNHDGRFNVHCSACGWYSDDIPAKLRSNTEKAYLHKPCPKCGATFYNIRRNKK